MSVDEQNSTKPIAVVGISCRLPGGANSPEGLWQLLSQGNHAWTPVPSDRFNETSFHHPSADDPNGTNHHQGGHFIDGDVRDFDHSFFRISPQQAMAMDPQQRMLLEMTYEALESAGWSRESVAGSSTSVYAAMFTTDYDRNLYKDTLDLPVYYITGTEKAILANRISHYFDLHGPSVTLDTGCSGGLVALHQACQSLRDEESSASIVASANLTLNPDHYIGMSNLHLIGGSGRSFPFDDRGTGYGRGEGLVVLTLKRLEDALKDRDPIKAVIRGTAVNQDGYTPSGITYPNGSAQADLIRHAYRRSGLQPEEVSYVEAHGTGTVAGDTEELKALAEVFSSPTRSLPLYVGSIKGNIGHTENTSGLASLIKAVLILDRQEIPPVAGYAHPKPGLPLDKLHIATELLPLPTRPNITPTVSINSFGFGGTNSHAILQPGIRRCPSSPDKSPRLFILSAHNEKSLRKMMESYMVWLSQESNVSLVNLSYTLCHRRSSLPWRFSCVAEDQTYLVDHFKRRIGNDLIRAPHSAPYVAFVFTGQGAQWAGMGRELLTESASPSIFRDSIHRSRNILHEMGVRWDIEQELLRDPTASLLHTAQQAQPITTAIQLALVDMLRAQGVRPRVVVGHSSGEIAAAYAAGYISHTAAIQIAYHRGHVAALYKSRDLPPGAMMSVGVGEHEIAPYLEHLSRGKASIACCNSPENVTVSGDAEAVDEVATRLKANDSGLFHRRLNVDTAYHSHHMEAVASDYLDRLRLLQSECDGRHNSGVAFISSVSGIPKTSDFGPAYWTANLVSKVCFSDAIQTLARYREADDTGRDVLFIEIGPHPALAGPVRQSLGAPGAPQVDFDYQPTFERKKGAVSSILRLAGYLFERGAKLDFNNVSSLVPGLATANVEPNLPLYAWDHSNKHWHESRISRQYRMRRDPYHDLLGVQAADSTSIQPRWRHMICLSTLPWLAHHVVDGLVVFPGSGYLCMVSEAMRKLSYEYYPFRKLETLALRDVSFLRALIIPDSPQRVEVQLSLDPRPGSAFDFSFRISAFYEDQWHEHCSGVTEGVFAEGETVDRSSRCDSLSTAQPTFAHTKLDCDELYQRLAKLGNLYGSSFMRIRSFMMASDASQALSTIEIPNIASLMPEQHQAPHLIHPSTLDVLLHTALPLVEQQLGRGSVMPTHVDELLLSATDAMARDPESELRALTTLTTIKSRTSHANLYVESEGVPVVIASGIEMRSLGDEPSGKSDTAVTNGICYELDWIPDLDSINTHSLSQGSNLESVIGLVYLKHAAISALELGADCEELSQSFFAAVETHNYSLASYDLAETTPEHTAELQYRLQAHSIPSRVFNSGGHMAVKVPEMQSYDVVLLSDASLVDCASSLLKSRGTLLLRSGNLSTVKDASHMTTLDGSTPLVVKLICPDNDGVSSILVARLRNGANGRLPTKVCMLSPLTRQPLSPWARALESRLRGICPEFTLGAIGPDTTDVETQDDTCFLVVDDGAEPLISDPRCFGAVKALLNKPAQLIWISRDDPSSFHQIVGVSRSSHAENENLRLTTIHAAVEVLRSEELVNLVVECLKRAAAADDESSREREYRIRKDGTILVPRLRPSDRLNRAVYDHGPTQFDVEDCCFTDADVRLVFPTDDNAKTRFFIRDDTFGTALPEDEVQIETEAFLLSEVCLSGKMCEYVGTISHIGTAVTDLSPGDRVIAVGSVAAANRIRVPRELASLLPRCMSSEITGMLLNLMAGCYAINSLARLSPSASVLIHGASSTLGRAAVAAARSIGVRTFVTAADHTEAKELTVQCNISPDDIWVSRRSLHQRPPSEIFSSRLDAIILSTADVFPAEALAFLKPFGSLVAMEHSVRIPTHRKSRLPSNAVVHYCDIVELLNSYPELKAGLLERASAALEHFPINGLDLCTRDVAQVAWALDQIESGSREQVVVTVGKKSRVQTVVAQDDVAKNPWADENASYVVAGGLGDLGRRLLLLMAERGAKHLVSLSRSVPDPKDQSEFQAQLASTRPGCHLHCIQCNLTSERSIQHAAALLNGKSVPPVRGVIHSAALLRDRPLSSMTYDDFSIASKVKVDGTLALERVFKSPSLDFFIMLSSAVNIVGASGQANYNAGNAVQDAVAQTRQGDLCHYLSLNIGWIEDAIHTAKNEARLGGLVRSGLRVIQHDELSRFLGQALDASKTRRRLHQAIIGFDHASLSEATSHNGNIHSPMFAHVRRDTQAIVRGGEISVPTSIPASFQGVLATGDNELVLDFISKSISDQLVKLISVDASRINDRDGSLLEFGLDSLIAIELRNWLMREFQAPLQSSEIMDDQSIRALGRKVASRSRIRPVTQNGAAEDEPKQGHRKQSEEVLDKDKGVNGVAINGQDGILTPLPVPLLKDSLRRFQESRSAIDLPEEQSATYSSVQAFLEGIGPFLQQKVEESSPATIADHYEKQIYLERREPLQDYSEFSLGHPLNTPAHSQSLRAAIITITAVDFARRLTAGDIPPDTLHGKPVTGEARDWLFWTTHHPGADVDHMERFEPTQSVIILRHGHTFHLTLPSPEVPLDLSSVHAAFEHVVSLSESTSPHVCTLTADTRQSWSQVRKELEVNPTNAATLRAIDSAMFVVCLDDESPTTSGERHTQFLIGGKGHAFTNRWLDKPIQFVVAANGLSAGIYEHTKIDGLNVRILHQRIIRTLFAHNGTEVGVPSSLYEVHRHVWQPSPAVLQRIQEVRHQAISYHHIDHRYVTSNNLGASSLRIRRASPHATAHLVSLLAVYLVDMKIRPAWEIVSLGHYSRGRLEWVQTVFPPVRSFIEMAATIVAETDVVNNKPSQIRSLFDAACAAYSRGTSAAARGLGFVNHLYALRGALQDCQAIDVEVAVPDLFRSRAWDATRRGGVDQDLKIGFMPDDGPGFPDAWDEGGFLMHGDRGIYIHCGVRDDCTKFAVSARPDYADAVCNMLYTASTFVSGILG
ncbi:putative polyketide synthase protein [Seiridium cardinale]